jgi:ABC-2 type transport system ATP-binding protein
MDNVPAIQTVNLSRRFGSRVAVDCLDLNIKQGELYCLLGDNGAGKTTTLNMLTTLLRPSQGEFFICGFNGLKQSEECKGAFGLVSQDVAIYHELTAYENLFFMAALYKLPKKKAEARIKELLEQSGLTDRANDLVQTFSGGMERRLTIAVALLHEPKVIFMDEPTVGLDPVARRQIWGVLHKLREQGVTILLTTHYLEEAEVLADRIGIIRQGKLIIEGTMSELRSKIQAIRKIAVRLSSGLSVSEIQPKFNGAQDKLGMQIEYDAIHNTLLFSQSKTDSDQANADQALVSNLQDVLSWLKSENIPCVSVATAQPSLEEIFIAMTNLEMAVA